MFTIMNNLAILVLMSALWVLPQQKNTLYEWRGKDRKGIYQESNLQKEWAPEGPKVLWKIENIGNGFVSPVFTNDCFFITGEVDTTCVLFCFSLKGEKIWQTTLGREWVKTYPGARSAATVIGDLLYVGSGMGNLYCVNRKSGKVIWSKELVKDFNGVIPMHGYSEAPLIAGDNIFWTPGGKVNNVVCLNRQNGKLIWSHPGFGEASAYNPPKLIELPSRRILVTFSMYHLMGFDIETGKLLWSHEQDNTPLAQRGPGYGDTHSNTVLYEDGAIYYCAGDGNCGVKLKLSTDGTQITQVWRNRLFDSYMGGIVKIGNFIYGGSTTRPLLTSINATTGMMADSLRIGTGAVIAADNMLYYYNQKGDMSLVSYDNEGKMKAVSTFRIKEGTLQHFAHPVINNGVLYQRHGRVLVAYDIRKK
jgi:outer membrane protein assembly factor BamB